MNMPNDLNGKSATKTEAKLNSKWSNIDLATPLKEVEDFARGAFQDVGEQITGVSRRILLFAKRYPMTTLASGALIGFVIAKAFTGTVSEKPSRSQT